MIHLKYVISLLLVYSTLLASIPASARGRAGDVNANNKAGEVVNQTSEQQMKKGLSFRLSEGKEQPEKQAAANIAPAKKLTDEEAQSVLKRLPAIKTEASDEQEFAFRERSLPAPRTGKTINVSFPASETREAPDKTSSAKLEVLRYMPEGAIPLAPQLSVTFSQPMVAVTSQAELEAEAVPVRLTPQPAGKWRWVGTKTLLFVPAVRFPMATQYSVTVPAGTKSATGGTLATAKTWSFTTPPPQLKNYHPQGGSNPRDALMYLEFDQRIDAEAVLGTVKVRAEQRELKIRLATQEEIARDTIVNNLSKAAEAGRWIAFRAVDPASGDARLALPGDSGISISVGPGTPSAEGPRKTEAAQGFSFRTYGPLRITKHRCGYSGNCSPFDTWVVEFSNPLDMSAFQESQVRIEPLIPGIKARAYYNTLQIEGIKKGRTTYKVTLDAAIKDQFGQTLEGNRSLTFNVGSAPPTLTSSGEGFIVLDPSALPRYSVYSVNHPKLKVSLYKVGPEHWEQFTDYMRWSQGYSDSAESKQRVPPGRVVQSKIIETGGKPDELSETRIDLSPALEDGLGQVVILVEPLVPVKRREREAVRVWIQGTRIGLDAFVDHADLLGWATSLKDGTPLSGVQMTIQPSSVTGQSASDGLARLELPVSSKGGLNLLVARQGRDLAILPEHAQWWNRSGTWQKRDASDYLRWYVFDDRKMYRPGEEVHIKGWIRRIGGGKTGDVGSLDGAVTSVSYTLKDSRGNEITKGNLKVNALGGFDTSFKLPGTMNLGNAGLQLEAQGAPGVGGTEHGHSFQVQEFRRPEFEVTAQTSEGPLFVGGSADSTVAANYYAGGGLPNAEVVWNVTSRPGHYTPPNRGDYTFGKWVPWWVSRGEESETNRQTFSGRTDPVGKHRLHIDFDSVNPPRPSSVTAEASVTDVNRQTWTATASMLVHPADLYVGLKSDRTFVQKGEPLEVQTIVTDLDGKAATGREVKMRAVLLDWVFENNEWKQKETNPQDCSVKSQTDAVKCTFQTKEGGTYRVLATIMDDRERRNESELTLWVAGGKTPPKRDVEQEQVELIPDRKEYQPGDTAQLLVQSPFYPAEGVVTLRRSGIVKTERFTMDGPSYTLKVPLNEAYVPNIHVQVDLVGAASRTDDAGQLDEKLPKRPAFAAGSLNLPIPPLARKLTVQATPRDKALEPGAETVVNVEVRNAQNRPVQGSEVAVVVVDESVLALTGYRLDDPLSVFYAQRGADTRDHHLRSSIKLGNPKDLTNVSTDQFSNFPSQRTVQSLYSVAAGARGGLNESVADAAAPAPALARKRKDANGFVADGEEAGDTGIRMRENFNALAVFAATVPTDANGRAQVTVKVPDNLTRYRVMAVSVAGGKQFGSGESAITARMPLMVRPSAPRFLNFGDRFELPVVLQNQTDKPMSVDVAVRATNADLTDGIGRRVTVPANDRVEVRFPTSAGKAGTARFQLAAVSGRWADASEVSLPVWTPATTEAFATYGEIDEGSIVQPVKAPANVIKQFGGLEITTSSTQLQALTDAVLYLVAYPYECSEQLSSRVLAVAALRDVLAAFKAKGLPPPAEIEAAVARDIKRLQGLQNDNGGFAFWRRGDESWPYVSIHAAHALQRAKEKKFDVPAEMLEKSKRYLREIEKHIPHYYSLQARRALISYALYVRHRMGDKDTARARKLIAEAGLDKLSLESLGWLLAVLSGDAASATEVEAIRRFLNNRATETAATAQFNTSYGDGDYLLLHSSRRTDGVILEALIGDQPTHDLIPKLVRGLLAHRKQGRWENTQENVFILLALDRYFATYERVTPDFIARAWLGERYAGDQQFRGRSTDRQQVNVPMRYIAETGGTQNLVLSKEGQGRLYYRIGMQYAPASLKLNAADYGFTVERVYEAIDNAEDVRRDGDGTWHIKAGARVRVRLTMVAPARRYHVALVDPIPAGLEALNPALAVTGTIPQDETDETSKRGWWWMRQWFEHQNLRDERVEAFASLLWEGVHLYTYVARATTPGTFVVPPPKAEEMYHPETFGRGQTDRVVVE
jgi:uncharacterized protein YfaS (alpha-2-macroglobulin family)